LQIADFKNQRLDAELLSNDGDQFTVETPREERARALGGMPFTMSLLRILTSAFWPLTSAFWPLTSSFWLPHS